MKRFTKPFIFLLFAGLLATPLLVQRFGGRGERAESVDRETALERYGFHLEEASKKAGIDFVHRAPELDRKLSNIMPQIASMGAGVSIVDFDRDGWNDIYLTNSAKGSANVLYRNNRDGTFTDVARELGVALVNDDRTGVSMGAVWGDHDNDGFEDLLVYKWGRTELFRNDGGRRFTKVDAGFPEWANINSAVWFDYDRDGLLDIFLAGYFREELDLWNLKDTRIMPESFEYANNGGRKYLYRNLGGGRFEEVGKKLGIDTNRWALAVLAADLTGNGYPDLFISNDYGISELFLNEEGRRFVDASESSGIGFAPKSGMNASPGDVFSDGRLAIYESNISEPGILLQGNNLWVPRAGAEGAEDLKFDNLAGTLGVEDGGWSWGAQFGDLNNDGHLDLFLTNGYVSADRDGNYWYDFSKITVGNNTIIGDAANWADMRGRSLSGYQNKRVWVNDGGGRFQEVAQNVGVTETYDGRAVALADLFNRGVLDVIVAHQKAPVLVYQNQVRPGNGWIQFELEGTASNRSAIGAQVRLFRDGKQHLQEVHGGSGYCSQNQRRLHFGLGPSGKVEKVVVRWPSGRMQTIENPEPNRLHRLREE